MHRRPPTVGRRQFLAAAGSLGVTGAVTAAGGREVTVGDRQSIDRSVEVVVRFGTLDVRRDDRSGPVIEQLKRHARRVRRPFREFVSTNSGISIDREFWLANAVLATIDPMAVSGELTAIDGVTEVHPNYGGQLHDLSGQHVSPDAQPATKADPVAAVQDGDEAMTPSLEAVDAPPAWNFYDTRGEGVDVAVLDTGVDPAGHDDIAASLDRGGWAEFDERGKRVDSDPYDPEGHGTGVSGLVAGATTDEGVHYGVAPEVNLYHAKVFDEGLRFSSVLAGMEWALANDVDVLSLSIGPLRYDRAYLEPITNAVHSGVVVIGSAANAGAGTSASPGNIADVLSVGYVDENGQVLEDSGGERIVTERYWGDDAPESWDSEYVVPTVTAPGADLTVPRPGGRFDTGEGTSYAVPTVAGVVALVIAATDADGPAVQEAIRETAFHPAMDDPFDVDPGNDTRYGFGIVSAMRAITHLRASERLTGRVVDRDGTPLADVPVLSETGTTTTTDADGRYELVAPAGEQPIGATALGYDTDATRVDPAGVDTHEFRLEPADAPDLSMVERMARRIDPGTEALATFAVANVESVVVRAQTEGLLTPDHLTLRIDGEPVEFDEPFDLGDRRRGEEIAVAVAVGESDLIGQLQLAYEFRGSEETITGQGRLVSVHTDPFALSPTDPPTLQAPIDVVAPRTTLEIRDGVTGETVGDGDSAALVVDKPITLTAADGASPRIRIDASETEDAAGVFVDANDVTISGLTIEADGAASAIQIGTDFQRRETSAPSGVTIRNTTVSGARTGITAKTAPALWIEHNDITATQIAVAVEGPQGTVVRKNTIHGTATGLSVSGLVTDIDGNEITNIDGTAIRLDSPRYLIENQGLEMGPIRNNAVSGVGNGIAVSGYTNGPIEKNDLTEIEGTAITVDGGVLAPIRSNTIDSVNRDIVVAEGAQTGDISDNDRQNVGEPGAGAEDTPAGESGDDPSDSGGEGAAPGNTPRSDSALGLVLYGSTALALGTLLVPNLVRRLRRE